MSNQHRATSEHWAGQEQWASPPDSDPYATCLLELRDRVEALEAAALGRHGESAERAEPDPAASLVDRVAWAIFSTPDSFKDEGRAAIREVAAWLRENPGPNSAWSAVARDLRDEADR